MDALRQRLCGCLIGLARTCSNNPPTADTPGLLLAGLHLTDESVPAAEAQLTRMIERVQADKAQVSPNCVTCAARCGKNDDYDMARLFAAPDDVRAVKLAVLHGLQAMAHRGMMDQLLYDALFALAEDWDASALQWYADKVQSLLR